MRQIEIVILSSKIYALQMFIIMASITCSVSSVRSEWNRHFKILACFNVSSLCCICVLYTQSFVAVSQHWIAQAHTTQCVFTSAHRNTRTQISTQTRTQSYWYICYSRLDNWSWKNKFHTGFGTVGMVTTCALSTASLIFFVRLGSVRFACSCKP